MFRDWPTRSLFVPLIVASLLLPSLTLAEPATFDFEDPKGVNSMNIALYSMLEPIMGTARGVSGTVTFDPENPQATSGKISVAADQVIMANPRMTKMLHAEEWLNVEKYPSIDFELREVISAESTGDAEWDLRIRGDFTMKGVTMPLEMPVTLRHLPGMVKARNNGGAGDLLVLTSDFSFDRRDFNLQPERDDAKVAYEIRISAGLSGFDYAE